MSVNGVNQEILMLLFLPKNAYRIEMETDQGNFEVTK